MQTRFIVALVWLAVGLGCGSLGAQDKSVRPGVNDSFKDPKVDDFVQRFEIESREIYSKRNDVVEACGLKEGMSIADIGAGTGLFTRLFSDKVGKTGQVYAVDIAKNFLDHIQKDAREKNRANIQTVLCTADSCALPKQCVDMVFICDTYHHFEFPMKTLASIREALKPGGKLVLIDFRRIEGKSSEWTMNHVRAGQEVFEKEVTEAGFVKIKEIEKVFQDNYFVVFERTGS